MILRLAHAARSQQRIQQQLVRAHIEGRELEPLLEIAEGIARLVRCELDEAFEHGDVELAELPSLRAEPALEFRIAIDGQAFGEIAGELRFQRAQGVGIELLHALTHRATESQRVDITTGEIELERVTASDDAAAVAGIQNTSQFAQRPAQLAARIIGNIPQ